MPNPPCDLKRDPAVLNNHRLHMRRDSRPGQASCYRLVTKCIKINQHFAFIPPFQIGESSSSRNSSFQAARLNLLRSDTRKRFRCIRLSAVWRRIARLDALLIEDLSRTVSHVRLLTASGAEKAQ